MSSFAKITISLSVNIEQIEGTLCTSPNQGVLPALIFAILLFYVLACLWFDIMLLGM